MTEKLICLACKTTFEFSENPVNAFIGFLRDSVTDKPVEPKVTLCHECYRRAVLHEDGYTLENRPNLATYPMRWRAKYVPPPLNLPRNGLPERRQMPVESDSEVLQRVTQLYKDKH
jgi:hypothetical protein